MTSSLPSQISQIQLLVAATPASRSMRGIEEFIRLRRIATQASPLHSRLFLEITEVSGREMLPADLAGAMSECAELRHSPGTCATSNNRGDQIVWQTAS